MLREFKSWFLLLIALVTACKDGGQPRLQAIDETTSGMLVRDWNPADLRILDAVDASLPGQDIIAAYLRRSQSKTMLWELLHPAVDQIELRVDFLDIGYVSECDIYLALDYRPGGVSSLPNGYPTQIAWDTLVVLTSSGKSHALNEHGATTQALRIRVLRDPLLDYISISLDTNSLPGSESRLSIQLFSSAPNSGNLSDSLPAFHSDDPPPRPADLLFAFWNTFPAYTPAQALRRWDGAHTGPFGGRHGLYNLLRTARNQIISITLLDLKFPSTLSALDYAQGLQLVRKMASEGLLILPDVLPDLAPPSPDGEIPSLPDRFLEGGADFARHTSREFNLPASQFVFSPLYDGIPKRYQTVFTLVTSGGPDAIYPYRWRDKILLPIPAHPESPQATREGLSLETRKTILLAAISSRSRPENPTIVPLGGSLPESEWGVPEISRSAFLYILKHPWMHVLTSHDLVSLNPIYLANNLPARTGIGQPTPFSQTPMNIAGQLTFQPDSEINQNAWQAFYSLFGPAFPAAELLPELRANYAGQIDILLAAAGWTTSPVVVSSCDRDLDQDGIQECLMASSEYFAVIELDTGAVTHAFVRGPDGVHQILAPTSQFIVGISDPSQWNLSAGLQADPQVIPGAFADKFGPYHPTIQDDILILEGAFGIKRYQFSSQGIKFEGEYSQPATAHIPLTLDPWKRFAQDWGESYSITNSENVWIWKLLPATRLIIQSNAAITASHFAESRRFMGIQENPNQDYPPGHYLPFPIALITIEAQDSLQVTIGLEP